MKIRALILAVLAAAALSGCGGGGNDPAAVSLVKHSFSRPIGSADVSVVFTANLQGGRQVQGPVSLKLSGPYRSNGGTRLPSFDWNIATSGGGANFDGRVTSTGDDLYVGFQGQSYDVGTDTIARYNQTLAQGRTTRRNSLRDFGIDPAGWVKGAKDKGDANVAGTPTKHVSASIDFNRLLDDLNTLVRRAGSTIPGARRPPQLTASERKQFTDAIDGSSFDVYVGKADGKVRRLALSIEFSVPKSRRSQAGGVKGGTLRFSIEFSNVGRARAIHAPTGAKPLSDLVAQLAGKLPGTTGGGSPNANQFQQYSKCLDQAPASDPKALDRCSQLLK